MNDIERRALIGAAGIGAIAALSKAGPLNPPAGAVTGTGRTTDEIYNKIPSLPGAAAGGYDGRIPIAAAGIINTPGSYVVVNNISSTATPLQINVDDVTVDLNGFTLSSSSTTAPVISINGTRDNITVRNGAVTGGASCISVGGSSVTGVVLEDLRCSAAKVFGITFAASTSSGCTVRRCTVRDTGSTTVASDGNFVIAGISMGGGSHRVEDCNVSRLFYHGSGVATFRGINLGSAGISGNIIARCTVSHDAALTGNGVFIAGGAFFRDNTVTNFTTPYTGGTNGGGNL